MFNGYDDYISPDDLRKAFIFKVPAFNNHSQLPPQGSNENCSQYIVPVAQIFWTFKSAFLITYLYTHIQVVQIFSEFKIAI